MLNIFIWTIAISSGIFLFDKSAGGLNPCKINIISLAFYYIFIQSVLGAMLTSFGFTKHYTYYRLSNPEKYTTMGAFFSIVVLIVFPTIIIVTFKILRFDPQKSYNNYLSCKMNTDHSNMYFNILLVATILSSCLLIILLKAIGYLPLLELLKGNIDFVKERNRNVSLVILNGEWVKNIFVIYAIPTISYLAFIFAISTKQAKWIILAGVLIVESLIVKTYDFSKAPVVVYAFVFVIILVIYHNGINAKWLLFAGALGGGALLAEYRLIGYTKSFFDIYNGILGRTIFTQFGTLCMHFEAFSDYIPLLYGKSLYPTALSMIGLDPNTHVRSAQIVMEMYNPEGIFYNNAGVMNSLFIGEAYANWGYFGIIASIVVVAVEFATVFYIFNKLKKTPVTVAFFSIFTQQLTSTLQGGFTDYIYNAIFILNVVMCLTLYWLPQLYESLTKSNRIIRGR